MLEQPYQRRSHDEWQRLITEQQQSGHSQRDFCTANNLALSSFRNWKRRLVDTPAAPVSEPEWLQLPADLAGQGAATWDIELDLGNGVCLRLRRG